MKNRNTKYTKVTSSDGKFTIFLPEKMVERFEYTLHWKNPMLKQTMLMPLWGGGWVLHSVTGEELEKAKKFFNDNSISKLRKLAY